MLLSTIQFFPGQSTCHNQPKKKKKNGNFLQSAVLLYILRYSVGTVHFKGRAVYYKSLSKNKKYRLIYNTMSFEEKKFLVTLRCDVICN